MARFTRLRVTMVSVFLAGAGRAQITTRVSVDSNGVQGNGYSDFPTMSSDARYVAFSSYASNLVPIDTNGRQDVFVRDRQSDMTERVSVDSGGTQGNDDSGNPWISAGGRYVTFVSHATNLVTGDTNVQPDVFVHDRQLGTTERVSISSGGAQGNADSYTAGISADGRYVAFSSYSTNLVPGDTNGSRDVFVHDRQSGQTSRVSVDSSGVQGNGDCDYPAIAGDASYVAFSSIATNLVGADTNGRRDIFIHDLQSGQTSRVSVDSAGAQVDGDSYPCAISSTGRYVAFGSRASNLVAGDTNGAWDVFVHDCQGGTTERVSLDTSGVQGNGDSSEPSISSDGRCIAFQSWTSNLVPGDTNGSPDVFVHDRQSGQTSRVSVDSAGAEANSESNSRAISSDGRYVGFASGASNLVPGDTNGWQDVFLHDRGPESTITSFCFGDGTGIPCPCGDTGQPGRGCNNSISTGGALLAGSGEAQLSADTLLLTASQERPTAFSLVWQGGSEIPPRLFGDGIACMGSPLKRMYGHNAVGGVVIVPQGADLSVSARSAALGNPITGGSIRVYHVFYRDPDPNFCPSPFGSTFNTTNGLRVLWGQ